MGYLVLIIVGFTQIGIGVAWWANDHYIEKTKIQETRFILNTEGELFRQEYGGIISSKIEVVKNEE